MEIFMKIAICDNDPADVKLLTDMTRKIAEEENIRCETVCFDSAQALLAARDAGESFHALLLDVVMPGMDGLELAAKLRARQDNISIIFVSSNREKAMCGYEVAASRYLAKPLEEEKLREALRFCSRAVQGRQALLLPTARGVRKFSPDEIVYIETWGRGARVVLQDGQEEVGMKISELEAKLPPQQFVLCHRTLLVNLAFVRYLRYCEIELKTGSVLPVSKYRQQATREKLMNYLEG